MSDRPAVRAGWMPGIEALRAIAALSVVLHHSWSLSNQPHFFGYQIVEGFGSWGVDLFFLLSGYLLGEWFWRERTATHNTTFLLRRFFRIAPAYYVNVAVLFLFFAVHAQPFSSQGVKQIAANATFTQFLFPNTSSNLNVNGALWTLTIEMMLYLAMPVMAVAVRRRPYLASGTMVAIGIGWLLMVSLAGDRIMELYFGAERLADPSARLFVARQFPGQLPLFAIGLLLRWVIVKGMLPERLRWTGRVRVSVIGLLLLPSIGWLFFVERASDYHRWVWFTSWNFILGLLFVPVIIYTSATATQASRSMKVGVWLGERSYGIYLWHFPIVLTVYGIGPGLNPPPSTYMALRVVGIVLLAIIAGAVSFSAVEDPARRFGQGITRRMLGGPSEALANSTQKAPRSGLDEAAGTSAGDAASRPVVGGIVRRQASGDVG